MTSTAPQNAARETVERPDGRKTRSSRTETLVEQVRNLILEDIIRAKLKPGTMIQLTTLAEQYQVSRTPIREALTLLERQGLVSAIPYKGYLIKQIDPRDVRDIFFMRRLLEGAAVELAVPRLDAPTIARLRKLEPPQTDVMTLAYDTFAHDFHRTLVSAAGMPRLLEAFEHIYNDVRRLQYAGIGNPRPDLIRHEHDLILDAIEAGDTSQARELMEEHIDLVRTRALEQWMSGS